MGLVLSQNEPELPIGGGGPRIFGRRAGKAKRVGMPVAQHLGAPCARGAVRGDQRGGINFKMGLGGQRDIARHHKLHHLVLMPQQQPTCLKGVRGTGRRFGLAQQFT